MITSLTTEQTAAMTSFAREWINIGLSTAPTDRKAAEAAIHEMYRCGGLTPPENIVWCTSPMALIETVAALIAEAKAIVKAKKAPKGARMTLAEAKETAKLSVPSSGVCVAGQHEAGWLARNMFFREHCGLVAETDKLAGLVAVAKTCGWVLPYEYTCFASPRPCVLKLNEAGFPHCVDGPAIAWPAPDADTLGGHDKLYYVRGIEVPAAWIEQRDTLDPTLALTHPNIEQRACVPVIVGWHKVMAKLQPRVIDARPMSVAQSLNAIREGAYDFGELIEVDLPDEGPARFLAVLCPAHIDSDGGQRYLRVPPETQTAKAANAWTYGLTADEFAPEGRS